MRKSKKPKAKSNWRRGLLAGAVAGVLALIGGSLLLAEFAGSDAVHQGVSFFQTGSQVYIQDGCYSGQLYGARITAFASGKRIPLNKGSCEARGSTLPDPGPYPSIAAGHYSFRRGQHFGSVTNGVFNDKVTPALILNPGEEGSVGSRGLVVPTLEVNESPYSGQNYGLAQASQIHVHAGLSESLRGSAGCLTIKPSQAKSFFTSRIGTIGMVHVSRCANPALGDAKN
jgi:hypothetical protein